MEYIQQTGRIFDIQRFSIHDGPGIRTIIFLKGCPLRCQWCCNPESQNREIETMTINGKPKQIGKDVTVKQVIEEVLKDRLYYRRSGGGMTLSGGESLLQPEFASALLCSAKKLGIHTAMESTAFGEFSMIAEKILPYLDLFLMDIKHMDDEKHRQFTGQSNRRILENARKLAESGCNLIIRVPIIPSFNDTPKEIAAISRFVASLSSVKQLHLLPYHRLGQGKYTQLGRKYFLTEVLPPTEEKIFTLSTVAQTTGLKIQIGG